MVNICILRYFCEEGALDFFERGGGILIAVVGRFVLANAFAIFTCCRFQVFLRICTKRKKKGKYYVE